MNIAKFRNYQVPGFRNPSFFDDFVMRDFFQNKHAVGLTIPSANIIETEKSFKIELAAPGMEKSDFNVQIEKDVLTISSEKKQEEKVQDEKYTRQEFAYRSFSRSFTLPETIDHDLVKAVYENGILSVELPKKTEVVKSNKKMIEIV
ncbi:MAG: Hsp20/alpha crystallin family protein [Flavobacteriales bacterium]|nr:Hsp20/alpha crystallin family protein [Flavobacteriales bacterium]